ncbi:amino acid adenylation domain-containing protein [Kitasatospora sp. NPDC092286]|uniref:amino acid adenylation domain-containing protein n=1 Tax=Kitasatospora sp. NPDC092286 TaxID=3364087 RepID=UPI00381F4675
MTDPLDGAPVHQGGELPPDEADVPSAFPFGGSCSRRNCGTLRRSSRLTADLAAALGDRADEAVLAALLILARKYSDGTAFRIGVRRASWPAQEPTASLVGSMPSALTAARHRRTVVAGLAGLTAAPRPADAVPPKLLCVLDGPADGRYGADLVVSGEITADGITLHADCHDHVHDAAFADRLLGHLAHLLRQTADRPDTPIGDLRLLTGAEREQLAGFNDTRRHYPRDAPVFPLFAAQAAAHPDRIAVSHADESLTYRQLEERAADLAARLHRRGVGRHSRVAFLLERSPRLVVAALAILRLGAAYVPLDPDVPAARRDFLLADSGAALLLTEDAAVTADIAVLDLSQPHDAPRETPPPAVAASPSDAAYVMYTSGTTGRPKGVLVNQRAVVRLVLGTDYVDLSPETRILQTGAIAFDATTFEFWGALLNGGTLVLVPDGTVLSAAGLGAAISRYRVNTMFLTSSLFNQIVEQDPSVLAGCQVLVGGEAVSARHVAEAMDACPDSVFVNAYGPTENTTFSVAHRITRRYAGRVPIGRPIANSTAWVLDRDGHPQPIGVPGELCVGGDGLTDGYLNRPDLNAGSFFLSGSGPTAERLYRTGDRARWTAEGLLDCLGRADTQVKIRGFRVELAEVESRLARLPSVRESVVLLCRRPGGLSVLCAYVTADAALNGADLRTALLELLPDYMVPSSFRQLDTMPRTRNGKVDRAALAALEPVGPTASDRPRRAPRTPLETTVAAVFAEVLGLPSVSVDDDFFDLGGHSLRVMRLWNRIRAVTGTAVELKQILDAPTVAGVVAALERGPASAVTRPKLVRRS